MHDVPRNTAPVHAPLNDDEWALLADLLDEHAELDIDGVLGLFCAVGVGPSLMSPSAWLPLVLPDGPAAFGRRDAERFFLLVMRLYNEVLEGLHERSVHMPDADDLDACTSFAHGFVTGAEADPVWRSDDAFWSFASWAAYMSGRNDLVPESMRAELDVDHDGSCAMLARKMDALVSAANEHFSRLRRQTMSTPQRPAKGASVRVGRNEPCPCGSGKKYKRCCLDGRAGAETSARDP